MALVGVLPEPEPRVFLRIQRLQSGRPSHVWRSHGMTLLTCDPRHSRLAITSYNLQLLTEAEANVVRRAYGLPPVHQPAPNWITEDGPAFVYVPPELRLHGAPAIQGGRDLPRRRRLGLLDAEWRAWQAELARNEGQLA